VWCGVVQCSAVPRVLVAQTQPELFLSCDLQHPPRTPSCMRRLDKCMAGHRSEVWWPSGRGRDKKRGTKLVETDLCRRHLNSKISILDGTLPLDLRSHKSSRITHTSLPPHASSTQPIHCPGHTPPAVLSPHNEILGSARAELASELHTHTHGVWNHQESRSTHAPLHTHAQQGHRCVRSWQHSTGRSTAKAPYLYRQQTHHHNCSPS
jgi:hypothetical protein